MRLAVISALKQELSPLLQQAEKMEGLTIYKLIKGAHQFYLLWGGLNLRKRQLSLQKMLSHLKVEGLINLGFAGALTETLPSGEIVQVKKVVSLNRSPITLHLTSLACRTVTCFSSSRAVKGEQAIHHIRTRYGTDIVDMELFRLAVISRTMHLPLISLKIISDHCEEEVEKIVRQKANRLSQLLGEFFLKNIYTLIEVWSEGE